MQHAPSTIMEVAGATLPISLVVLYRFLPLKNLTIYLKVFIPVASIMFGILTNYDAIRSLGSDFGIKIDRICDYVGRCASGEETAEARSMEIDNFTPATLRQPSAFEICGKALNSSRSNWATERSALDFVNHAKSSGEQVDSCRLKIGLPTLQEEQNIAETQRLKRSSDLQICQAAIDTASRQFSSTGSNQRAVVEALHRQLSLDSCNSMLGLGPSQQARAAPIQTSVNQSYPTRSNSSPPQNALPLATIYNDAVKYAHLRREADGSSEILARLPNGIEVVILGERLSDRGQSWCRVRTSNGSTGYVFSKFVTSPCRLTEQQYQAFNDVEQKRSEETARAFGNILGAVLQNLPKK